MQTLSEKKKRQTETSVRLPGSPEVRPPVISFYSNAALLFMTHAGKLFILRASRSVFKKYKSRPLDEYLL